jgi:aconitate hydratase
MTNSFGARNRLTIGDEIYEIYRLDRVDGSARLPYSLKVLLENLLRNEDGVRVTAEQVSALASWDPMAEHGGEIQFSPARVLLVCRAWSIWWPCGMPWRRSEAIRT